jgi:signal transduction histidine kinase/CheY-like chemotaxis protein
VTTLEEFVEASSEPILVVDARDRVLYANPAFAAVAGAPAVGAELDSLGRRDGTMLELTNETEPLVLEAKITTVVWGAESARLLSFADVTERRKSVEIRGRLAAADRLRSIGQLAAGIAHEVNNPATFVMSNTEALVERLGMVSAGLRAIRTAAAAWDDAQRAEVDEILFRHDIEGLLLDFEAMLRENKLGLERIVSIVGSLRAFARMDEEGATRVNLNDVVADATTIVRNEIRARARLVVDLRDLPEIAAHRGKLAQVLVNVLVNAAHAIEEGRPDEQMITIRTERSDRHVTVSVQDTGCGIAPETLSRVFDPFFTTKPREEGTGLGLSLSAEITRQHGGDITIESVLGSGTRVKIELPIETGLPLRDDGATRTSVPGTRHARVLIVDDETMIINAFRRVLGDVHEVIGAEGGTQAKELLERDAGFDLILCDLMMPDCDGAELYDWIGARIPHLLRRIVFVSGGAFTPRLREFVANVDNELVEKPVSATHLRLTIQRMLGTVRERP